MHFLREIKKCKKIAQQLLLFTKRNKEETKQSKQTSKSIGDQCSPSYRN